MLVGAYGEVCTKVVKGKAPSSLEGFRFLSVGITVGITALTTSSVLTVSKKIG